MHFVQIADNFILAIFSLICTFCFIDFHLLVNKVRTRVNKDTCLIIREMFSYLCNRIFINKVLVSNKGHAFGSI